MVSLSQAVFPLQGNYFNECWRVQSSRRELPLAAERIIEMALAFWF